MHTQLELWIRLVDKVELCCPVTVHHSHCEVLRKHIFQVRGQTLVQHLGIEQNEESGRVLVVHA